MIIYSICINLKNWRRDNNILHVFFYFSDMHLHAYSKASYQTHTNTLCHLHELQIISGTSVQIRIKKLKLRWRMRNGTGEEEQNKYALMQGRLQHVAIILRTKPTVRSVTDLGQNTIQDAFIYLVEVHLSRLSGLNKADHWAVKTGVKQTLWNKSVKNRIRLHVCPAAPIGNTNRSRRTNQ